MHTSDSDQGPPPGCRIPSAWFGASAAVGMVVLTLWLLNDPPPGVFLPFAAALLLVVLGVAGLLCVAFRASD